jgi:hypothetical protein
LTFSKTTGFFFAFAGASIVLTGCAPKMAEVSTELKATPLQWLDSLIDEDSARGCRLLRIVSDGATTDSLPISAQSAWREEFLLIRNLAEKALHHRDNRYFVIRDSLGGWKETWTNAGAGGSASQVSSLAQFSRSRHKTSFKALIHSRDLLFESEDHCFCEKLMDTRSGLRCTLEMNKKALWPAKPLFVRLSFISYCP